jgi:hypothetical protein
MNDISTIERLPDESARAYRARVEYVTMGPGRSLDKLRAQSGHKAGIPNRRSTLAGWSTRFDWQATAVGWDNQQAAAIAQAKADEYRQKIEAHREKAEQAGDALFTVAGQLIKAVNQALAGPRKIKGEDGKVYTVHAIELNANTFSIAAKAMQVALDLKAHSLGIERLIPLLDDDSE